MKYLSLTIPGYEQIDSGLPSGVPTGGFLNSTGNAGTGFKTIQAFILLIVIVAVLFGFWNILKGGLDIIQSQGHKEPLKRGRERVLYGIWGLILVFLCFLFAKALNLFIGFNFFPWFFPN